MNKKDPSWVGDGLLPIYKPKNMISKDVSRILTRSFGKLKIGHVGTLDPMAEGVLPIVLGKGTRMQDFLLTSEKIYDVTIQFGLHTDTLDVTGETVETSSLPGCAVDLEKAGQDLVGVQTQVPPIYSAVKYNGRPLYEYARTGRGDEVPLEELSREIEVYRAELIGAESDNGCYTEATYRISASKGTYVRVLAFELAKSIGCLGTMLALKRVKTAGVVDQECISLEQIENNPERINEWIIPIHKMPLNMLMLRLPEKLCPEMIHGRTVNLTIDHIAEYVVKNPDSIDLADVVSSGSPILLLAPDEKAIGIGQLRWNNDINKIVALTKKRGL